MFDFSLITVGNILKWPFKYLMQLLRRKEARIKKNEEDIRVIKEALHNFYTNAMDDTNPGEKPRGIEKLKDI